MRNKKNCRDFEEYMRKVNNMFKDDFTVGQKVVAEKEELYIAEEVVEKDDIIIEFVGVNFDFDRDGARPAEATEVISEEEHNLLVLVVYTRPFKVITSIPEAIGDAMAEQEPNEHSEDNVKPKEKNESTSKTKTADKRRRRRGTMQPRRD
ncbi:hypothetical protein V6N13_142108 [Hibiscus sabdariffa]